MPMKFMLYDAVDGPGRIIYTQDDKWAVDFFANLRQQKIEVALLEKVCEGGDASDDYTVRAKIEVPYESDLPLACLFERLKDSVAPDDSELIQVFKQIEEEMTN